MTNVKRGSFAKHAEQFPETASQGVTPRWVASQIVALDSMLTAAVVLRRRGLVRKIAHQLVVLDRMLTDAITAATEPSRQRS